VNSLTLPASAIQQIKTSASVTYTGTRGYDQFRSRDVNAPLPPLYLSRPNLNYSVVREVESAGQARGISVQFTLKGQIAPRSTGSVQYTLSKAMNDTSGVRGVLRFE